MHLSLPALSLLALLSTTTASLLPTHPLLARDPSSNPLAIRITNTLAPRSNPPTVPINPANPPPTTHRQPTTCPNYATSPINPANYLGAEPNGCSWKGALICANLLVGCPAVCIGAALEAGINPFTDVPCLTCLGYGVGSCAECFVAVGGFPALCAASRKLPKSYAGCMGATCPQGFKIVGPGFGGGSGGSGTGTGTGTGSGATA